MAAGAAASAASMRSYTNYALLVATALLVLISAHAKSTKLNGNGEMSLSMDHVAAVSPDRPIDETRQQHHQQHHHHHQHRRRGTNLHLLRALRNRRAYHSKYSIEQLLHMQVMPKVSNDIDMDPCKADEDANEEEEGNVEQNVQADAPLPPSAPIIATKFNATFQLELEKLKQEVYHEGLQVEEEGLTDIIRKKTKLPSIHQVNYTLAMTKASLNDNEPVKPSNQTPSDYAQSSSYKNEVLSPPERRRTATKSEGIPSKFVNKSQISHRNVDVRKIQSNNKDIEDDSGNNFVAERRPNHIVPTSLPEQRSTLPNVYSNAGGNGMQLDDEVDFLHARGVVRRRHRRGPKHR
ncbi:uncharacterized protein Dwil_GK27666 [Drosophila willistoni]|uniref:Uncharacterized protein n=1 Tax=Drosophila willistoni TaxID=7260 RepID=A0A0Q9X5B9_DROWI|nr:uncharacterized protein Dwil_GK27666 [Drosophila willistoni]